MPKERIEAPGCLTLDYVGATLSRVPALLEVSAEAPPATKPTRIMTRRAFLRRATGGTLGLMTVGWGWGSGLENKWVEVTRVEHPLTRLNAAWNGTTIAQISDIHLDGWMTRERLSSIVAQINALKPDIVCLTGDYVTGHPPHWAEDLTAALSKLRAPLGVFAVLGNHDHWRPDKMRHALALANVRELNNTVHTLRRDSAPLHIAGMDSVLFHKADIPKVAGETPQDGASVLLVHEPDIAGTLDYYFKGRFDLQLSGHSHGGQICLPFVAPLRLPYMGTLFPRGLYQLENLRLYTNRGVGMVGPHLRVFCRPEITLHTLRSV